MTTVHELPTSGTLQIWRSANGQLWRLATSEEIAAQIAHDATRTLSKYERSRPKRKSVKTHRDVVELGVVRAPLQHEPIGVGDKPYPSPTGIVVIQVKNDLLVEQIHDVAAYLKEAHRKLREEQRAAGK